MRIEDTDYLAHGATLTVDLDALADNWRLLRARAGDAECGAVIKADAYGLGVEHAAWTLHIAGCRTFFVAHLSEAKRARASAQGLARADATAIYVLNGFPAGAAPYYLTINARPVIGSVEEALEWAAHGQAIPCALHVDTGMNRLGFSLQSLDDPGVAQAIAKLNVDLVMTHLVASEIPDDPINAKQIAAFGELVRRFPGKRHSLLNSSGHFLDGAPAGHVTRPGYALYGGNPTPGKPNPMKPVIGLDAHIIAVRDIAAGERAGYNGLWLATERRKIATLSIGYADGMPRNAGGIIDRPGGYALVGCARCPFVGTVSMDLIIIDVSHAPADAAKRGAPATIIGGELDLETVGAGAKTIGYEILTSLGRRYRRVYGGA